MAAEFYHRGLANKVLVFKSVESKQVLSGDLPSYTQLTCSALMNLGVPPTAIVTFGNGNKNTRHEAFALREWADQNATSAFIIPTEILNSQRVRWIFRREFLIWAVLTMLGWNFASAATITISDTALTNIYSQAPSVHQKIGICFREPCRQWNLRFPAHG